MKTQNTFIALALLLVTTFSVQAQTLNPTVSITTAGSANTFKGGYTFAYATSGTPWNGALMSFGGFANQYDCQLSTNYSGNNISFRTKNGDLAGGAGIWNSWNELVTTKNLFSSIATNEGGFLSLQNPLKTGSGMATEWKLYNMTGAGYGNSLQFWAYGTPTGFTSGPRMTLADNGNLGIGTTTPSAKLDIFGGNATSTNLILSANYKDVYRWRFNTLDRGNAIDLDFTASDNLDTQEQVLKLSRSNSGRPEFQLYNNAIVANDGFVGIGTASPDAKLTVKGQIHSQEVKIDLLGALIPDYVFANDYKLKTLNELETYIQANSHLPEIPSAKEMSQNGMLVSEMNLSLLKKIEELTLYAIEQQKKLDAQNKAIMEQNKIVIEQNKQFELLATRLSKLEKK
jgi:Phage T4 tail fibre